MSALALSSSPTALPTQLNDSDLAGFQALARDVAGIELDETKRLMIYSRFSKRLRALGLSSFSDYLTLVQDRSSGELEHFINTITTNLTYFFRESHHFEFLGSSVAAEVMEQRSLVGSPARIWSAGCSLGAEPYSLAITLEEAGYRALTDYRILCTDIDTDMVEHTAAGRFTRDDTRGLSDDHRREWFEEADSNTFIAREQLRKAMVCKVLNLFGNWPIKPGVDIIFCRNVLIYFNKPAQDQIINGFATLQNSGGFLFLGHSESLRGMGHLYERVSHTVYKRLS